MFDDLKIVSQNPASSGGSTAPPNLPIAGAIDVATIPIQGSAPVAEQVVDIFANQQDPASLPMATPPPISNPPVAQSQQQMPPVVPQPPQNPFLAVQPHIDFSGLPKRKTGAKKWIIIIIVIGISIIAGGVFAFMWLSSQRAVAPTLETLPDIIPLNGISNPEIAPSPSANQPTPDEGSLQPQPQSQQPDIQQKPKLAPDTDGDGISDKEEEALGTNVFFPDSDFDGLTDYEEVKIYGTNPLLKDTDGDTYEDGNEVRNGYNPVGPGKMSEQNKP